MLGRNTIGFVNTIYIYIKKVKGGRWGSLYLILFESVLVGIVESIRSYYDQATVIHRYNTMARLRLLLPYYCGIGLDCCVCVDLRYHWSAQ